MNIIDRLDEYLLREYSRERKSHYPSDVLSCMRQLYYKWNNVEKTNPPSAGNIIKMKFGNLAEVIIKDWLDYELIEHNIINYSTQSEITGIEPDLTYRIHGYEDFVVETENRRFGIECKSSFGRGVKDIQVNGPKEEHVLQVYQYMRYGTLNLYYLVYIGRDNGYRTQFECTYDRQNDKLYVNGVHYPIDWSYYINRLIAAEHTIGAAVEPEREYRAVIKEGEVKDKVQRNNKSYKTDWQCNYCNWRDLCWEEHIKKSASGKILYGGEEI